MDYVLRRIHRKNVYESRLSCGSLLDAASNIDRFSISKNHLFCLFLGWWSRFEGGYIVIGYYCYIELWHQFGAEDQNFMMFFNSSMWMKPFRRRIFFVMHDIDNIFTHDIVCFFSQILVYPCFYGIKCIECSFFSINPLLLLWHEQ